LLRKGENERVIDRLMKINKAWEEVKTWKRSW
jgi:hypothetical protein